MEGGNQSSGRGRGGRSQGTPSIGVTRFCPPIKLLELCFERGVPQQYAGNKAGSEIWVLRNQVDLASLSLDSTSLRFHHMILFAAYSKFLLPQHHHQRIK